MTISCLSEKSVKSLRKTGATVCLSRSEATPSHMGPGDESPAGAGAAPRGLRYFPRLLRLNFVSFVSFVVTPRPPSVPSVVQLASKDS